jgi:hypothetical protein
VPHAVVLVQSTERNRLEAEGRVTVRPQFVPLLRECRGYEVVLYQSSRQPGSVVHPLGYFAVATVTKLAYDVATGRCEVTLQNLVPIKGDDWNEGPQAGRILSGARVKPSGWQAAQDVREISETEFDELVRGRALEAQSELVLTDQAPLSRLRVRTQQWRDPTFGPRVYDAYKGICAISEVTLLGLDGYSDLEAAHIFPYALEAYDKTPAGILLAPNWHRRFDNGAITIHPDYTWSVNLPDADTDAIADRKLKLPALASDWPDKTLLVRKRQLFRGR